MYLFYHFPAIRNSLLTFGIFGLLTLLLLDTRVEAENSGAMTEVVQVTSDLDGFILHPSGQRFIPWGHNYASVDLISRLAADPERVAREFVAMKAAGTTVARIHPEMPLLIKGPKEADPKGLKLLTQLLKIAADTNIRLQITGLACYSIDKRLDWYDGMNEEERWAVQAFFWETIAKACAQSPAVFAFDLLNEPGAIGKAENGWYTGRMGDVEFCQFLTLDPQNRSGDEIFSTWTRQMIAAIRKHDPNCLVTMGMLPFPGAYRGLAEQLDFTSPHIYPQSGKVDEALSLLKKFEWGIPIVIGETFPLSCGVDEERAFLLQSRPFAQGWIGHWPDESPQKLAKLVQSGKASIQNRVWLAWTDLFQEIGPQMTNEQ